MMCENQMKALRWLANMFPYTHPAKSETDKMSNCIHLYCEQGANAIEELSKRVPPVPHGRLIDADALAAQCDDPYWCVWLSDIEDAPTIIPAELPKEET